MPDDPQLVRVFLGPRSYEIEIGTGNLLSAGRLITALDRCTHAVIITDEHVASPHAEAVAESLAGAGVRVDVLLVPPGEASKSVSQADGLWQALLEIGADRQTVIVAVGGGVIGDLAGFVAATFARGQAFVQVPTTLLAQVDSSVGGKTGVNLAGGKNMVGAFWQPRGVLIDTAVLSTLPEREYRAGLAEVVKYGVILDEQFFAYLEDHVAAINARDNPVLTHIIARCCRLKADVVERDEREETGLRSVLNYGHTFGHAIETLTGYDRLLHGEAVSMGMTLAAQLAERLSRVDAAFVSRQTELLAALQLPTEPPRLGPDRMLTAMARDKKSAHGKLRFVLASRLGHVELVGDIDEADVRAVLGIGAGTRRSTSKQKR